jgi:hypothetical protein
MDGRKSSGVSGSFDDPTVGIQVDPKLAPQDQLMQGVKQGGYPILAPDGKSGFVHSSQVDGFLQQNPGYRKAHILTAPDGTPGMVAADETDAFLKANPDYKLGQAPTGVETNPLAHNRFQEAQDRAASGTAPTTSEIVSQGLKSLNPLEGLRTIRDAASTIGHYLHAEGEAPDAAPFVKNVSSPVGEAAASFLEGQYEPETLATVGALHGVGGATPVRRLLQQAAGAYLGTKTAIGAAQRGEAAVTAAQQGNIPEAVRQGTGAAFDTAFAADAAHEASKSTPEAVQDVKDLAVRGRQAIQPAIDATKTALNPESIPALSAATRAFRPRNSKANWKQEVNSALPDMRRAADNLGVDVNTMSLNDALNATQHAKKEVWNEYRSNFADPNAAEKVSTSPVADAIRATISDRQAEQNPGFVEKINQIADTYQNRHLTVSQIEDRVRELNDETAAIEARYLVNKRVAKRDPANAPVFAERDVLKNLMLAKINELSGPGAAELRKRYGALISVEDSISRRIPVNERQAPVGLGKLLARAYAYGKIGGGILSANPGMVAEGLIARKLEKNAEKLNSADFLTQQAFKKTQPTAPPRAPVERVDGEYVTEPQLAPGPAQPAALPPGQYEAQPSALEPILRVQRRLQNKPVVGPSRMLPESTEGASFELPAENPVPNNQVETVGIPASQEANARQVHANRRGNPIPALRLASRAPGELNTRPVEAQEPVQAPEPLPQTQAPQEPLPAPQHPIEESPVETPQSDQEQYVGRPSSVRLINPKELTVDPKRFQWRNVPRNAIPESAPWDQAKAGPIDVWRDPQDGKLYVVEGHHRFNHAIRTNTPEIEVRQHEFDNAQTAKSYGALRNIELGNATPFDAAMYMRENGLKAGDLEKKGINLTGEVTQKASALANLSPALWDKYRSGDLDEAKASAIGANLDDPSQQAAMADLSKKQRLSAGELDQLARRIKEQGNTAQESMGLFGAQEDSTSNAIGTARVAMRVEKALQTDKAALKFIAGAGEARKAALERGKNIIDTGASGQEAMLSSAIAEQFRRSQNRKGQVSDLLEEAGRRVTKGDKPDAIFKDIYPKIRQAVLDELGGEIRNRASSNSSRF